MCVTPMRSFRPALPSPLADLIQASRRLTDASLAALEAQRADARRLLSLVEELEDPSREPPARRALTVSRESLLAWLAEARRCARAWRRHGDVLEAVQAGLVELDDGFVITEAGADALSRLAQSGMACHDAGRDLTDRGRELRIPELRIGLRAAVGRREREDGLACLRLALGGPFHDGA